MSIFNIDVGLLLKQLFSLVSEKPARAIITFTVVFVFAMAAALGFPSVRIPFAVTAAVALLAIVALGSLAAGDTGLVAPEAAASEVVDQRQYVEYLAELNGSTNRMWTKGEFADPSTAEADRGEVLEALLAYQAARLQNLGLQNASIVVVRREDDDFLVRRVGGPLKGRLKRGQRCRPNCDLDDALRRYVPHCCHALVDCCGRQHALAVTADVPLDRAVEEEVVNIAYLYQTQYERLRLYQLAAELRTETLPA